jgi:hypothetical protein
MHYKPFRTGSKVQECRRREDGRTIPLDPCAVERAEYVVFSCITLLHLLKPSLASWFFWVGIALRIEPYLEGAFPQVGNVIRRLLADGRCQKFFRVVGIVALLIAFFQAWNTQYEMVRQNDQRFAMKDLLGNIIVEGEAIVQSHKQSKEQADAYTYQHDAEKWAAKTDNLIEDVYGKG